MKLIKNSEIVKNKKLGDFEEFEEEIKKHEGMGEKLKNDRRKKFIEMAKRSL